MYVITNKKDNRIFEIGSELEYQNNGYPFLKDKRISFPDYAVNVYEVETVPEEIIEEKYCYTEEKGFYKNPSYVEPINEQYLQSQITDLQLALAELYESMVS